MPRPQKPQSLEHWRGVVFDRLILYTALVCSLGVISISVQEVVNGEWLTVPVLVPAAALMWFAAVFKRLARTTRAVVYAIGMLIACSKGLLSGGFLAPNIFVAIAAISVVLALSVGSRVAWATSVAFCVLLIGVAWHYVHGGIMPAPERFDLSLASNWARVIFTFFFFSAVSILAISFLTEKLARSEKQNAELFDALEREYGKRIAGLIEQHEMTAQLQEGNKLEALGRLAGGVAHDFNNLLTIILSNCALLKEEHPALSTNEDLEAIDKAGERAAHLARQLLAFGKERTIEPKLVDINAAASECIALLKRLIPSNIELEVELEEGVGMIEAGPGDLDQIVMNLCINARDAMPDGGRLLLTTSRVERIKPGGDTSTAYVCLVLTDTGIGMADVTRQRLFEPFFTTKAVGKGTGLGLSVVHGIVEQNDGFIEVASAKGEGTSFRVFLPLCMKQPTEDSNKLRVGSASKEQVTLLVVDDEPAVLRVLKGILRGAGYEVHACASAAEALDVYAQHSESIRLLVTDAIMPRMGGRELYEKLHALKPTLPVLFCSGYSSGMLPAGFLDDPKRELLNKPFATSQLLEKVSQLLEPESVEVAVRL